MLGCFLFDYVRPGLGAWMLMGQEESHVPEVVVRWEDRDGSSDSMHPAL